MKRKILVAYDGSDLSEKAIREAELQASVASESEMHILSVVSQFGLMTSYPAMAFDVEREMAEKLRAKLGKIKRDFASANVAVHAKVIVDHAPRNVGRAIVEYAEKKGVDLIIISCRGLGGVKGTILGSVSRPSCPACRLSCVSREMNGSINRSKFDTIISFSL